MSLRDKIGYTEETSIDYKQAMWKLLIASGGVVEVHNTDNYGWPADSLIQANWSYFGGHPDHMPVHLTVEALKTIESGVNWDETHVPVTGQDMEFKDTFTSNTYYVPYLCGLLIPNEGDVSLWWAKGNDFDYVLRQITQAKVTLQDAIEDTKRRLQSVEKHPSHWVYTCVI